MSSTNPPRDDETEKPDPSSLVWYFGESELSALLLAMVVAHCHTYLSQDKKAGVPFYLKQAHTTEHDLDSYDIPENADAITALAQQGYIEITHQDGPRIWAKVTQEGRTLLDRLHVEQQRKAAASWKHP